jgi:pSer/pThr/pTyr-binding forkhead associated (FHA) protein
MEEPEDKATQPTQPCKSTSTFFFAESIRFEFPSFTNDPYWKVTQLVVDPRRLGKSGSDMNEEDMSDIVCILHPDSATACEAAFGIMKTNPRYTIEPEGNLQNHNSEAINAAKDATTESSEPAATDSKDNRKRTAQRLDLFSRLPSSKATTDITTQPLSRETTQLISDPQDAKKFETKGGAATSPKKPDPGMPAFDLAIRLSANLKEPDRGWVFGRNPSRCDFILDDEHRRVSNTHFRIYINEYGTIMLEDTSTNGTAIDGTLLRAKEKDNGMNYQHTLEPGMVITLTMDPRPMDFRFIVRIPQRTDEAQAAYEANLADYIDRAKDAEHKRALLAGGNKQPVSRFGGVIL